MRAERFGDRGGARENQRIGVHKTARRIGKVLQQAADRLGLLGFHGSEYVFSLLGREFGDHVGRVVGVHFLQDVGGALNVEVLDDGGCFAFRKLHEKVGEVFVVHGLGDRVTLDFRQRRDLVGGVGGVQFTELSGLGRDQVDPTKHAG